MVLFHLVATLFLTVEPDSSREGKHSALQRCSAHIDLGSLLTYLLALKIPAVSLSSALSGCGCFFFLIVNFLAFTCIACMHACAAKGIPINSTNTVLKQEKI